MIEVNEKVKWRLVYWCKIGNFRWGISWAKFSLLSSKALPHPLIFASHLLNVIYLSTKSPLLLWLLPLLCFRGSINSPSFILHLPTIRHGKLSNFLYRRVMEEIFFFTKLKDVNVYFYHTKWKLRFEPSRFIYQLE